MAGEPPSFFQESFIACISLTYTLLAGYCKHSILRVPQYPETLMSLMGHPSDIPLDHCWCARPQLYFTCHLRDRAPLSGSSPKNQITRAVTTPSELIWCSTEPLTPWSPGTSQHLSDKNSGCAKILRALIHAAPSPMCSDTSQSALNALVCQQPYTSSVTFRAANSHTPVQLHPTSQAGRGATSMS